MGLWVGFPVRRLQASYSGRLGVKVLVPFYIFRFAVLLVVVAEGVGVSRVWKENGVGIGYQLAVVFLLLTVLACRFLGVLLVKSVELIS